MSAQTVRSGVEIPLTEEVRAFCKRHGVLGHLETAIALARQCFAIVGNPRVALEEDPESGDRYLVLEVRVEDDEKDCAQAHKKYLSTWANSIDWPEVRLIRLVYDTI